jgi:hypothetical protein
MRVPGLVLLRALGLRTPGALLAHAAVMPLLEAREGRAGIAGVRLRYAEIW